MLLLPVASMLAARVIAAVAAAPDVFSVSVPSAFVPAKNATVPPGAAVPLAGLTVAVTTVLPAAAIWTGFAASVTLVATAGGITVTVKLPVELAKLPAAV